MHVVDMYAYEARWTCDGCGRTTWIPFTCAADAPPPKAWEHGCRDLCFACRFDLIVLGLLGPAHQSRCS
jgi:hypothetical protein